MSGYIKIPDCNMDTKNDDCNLSENQIIILDKDLKKDCGCSPCKPFHPKQKGILMTCGEQSRAIEFKFESEGTTTITPNIEIARTTIDLSCLCSPMVTIDFNSITKYVTELDEFVLERNTLGYSMTLFKECENIEKHPLSTFDYFTGVFSNTLPYCFIFCDINTGCTGCCSYIVELTEVNATIIDSAMPITLSIEQGIVNVTAQGACTN